MSWGNCDAFATGRTIRCGVVGLGARGKDQLSLLVSMPDVDIVALCDLQEDQVQFFADKVEQKKGARPLTATDYREVLKVPELEVLFIFTDWNTHVPMAVAAMRAGCHVGMEVGGAASLEECWRLVRTAEETGKQCVMLENCCYDRNNLQVLNMVKKGVFGELVHVQGGYQHDLRSSIGHGDISGHYRRAQLMHRNGELYPTHELGPIANLLNINRGNRMTHLTSMASKARGLRTWCRENRPDMTDTQPTQGDIVTTMINCTNGETIFMLHDITLPRGYSRAGRVQGDRAIWMEDTGKIMVMNRSPVLIDEDDGNLIECWEPLTAYREEYEHPLWREYEKIGRRGAHGGMDFLVLRAFVQAIARGQEAPIDVYDAASWMAVTCLSEQSCALGGTPQPIPDFTNGTWIHRTPHPAGCFALDAVHDEAFAY